jgi:UDP-glucose 4-epimerase
LPLTIVGDGTQTRDFVYVKDVVDSFLLAGKSDATGMAINVGASKPISINEVARVVGGQTIQIPRRPGEPDVTHADIAIANEVLNWHPKTSFAEGMRLTISEIDLWKDSPVWSPETIATATKDWFEFLGTDKELK